MRKKLLFVILLILSLLFLISYFNYTKSKTENSYESIFRNNLNQTIKQNTSFNMINITAFKWDKMYVFPPYTTRAQMHTKIGIEWTTADTYIGYLIQKTSIGDYPLDDDSVHKLVFIKDNKVICDCTLLREYGDFTFAKDIVDSDNAIFLISISENKIPKIINKEPPSQP